MDIKKLCTTITAKLIKLLIAGKRSAISKNEP